MQVSTYIGVLLRELERRRLPAQVAWRTRQQKPKVNVDDLTLVRHHDVAVVPVRYHGMSPGRGTQKD